MALRLSGANDDNVPVSKKTVEQTFTKLTQLEHVLLRPDTYIGSAERMLQSSWVWDEASKSMTNKDISYPPGLYKIFDEILVNAADHAQRDSSMNTLKVDIDQENQTIAVWNNGSGIPVEMHKKEKVYVPELIFGHLLTSSNYDDNEKKVVGGRNGFGAKLANIFSTEFTIETADAVNGKRYKQIFRDNMTTKDAPVIRANPKNEAYTKITFSPDLSRFGLACLDNDIVSLMKKRVYDVAGVNSSLKVYLNGIKLNIKSFKDYVALYPSDANCPIAHERLNDRWEVAITASDGQLNQVSFVNSIWTIKGGTHVTHIADQIVTKVIDQISKKHKGMTVRPFQVKSHLSLYINCLIENPSFDSQTKETLTTKHSKFGSKWSMSDELVKKVLTKTTIVENVLAYAKFKQSKELSKTDGGKKARVTGIPKLDDANKAGSREASKCTLILTEGDSAKALAISGLSVIGRDYYGVFPLRGKLLNVREAKHKQIMDNAEINNLKKILGLQHNKTYTKETVKSLRYGHVLIMTDQDHDGSHIKGLVINFFDHFWPSLLQVDGFLQEFITPIVKCVKGNQDRVFFTIPEYKNWTESSEGNQRGWRAKYYKGLGTSTAAEAKAYFSNLTRHRLEFEHQGDEDIESIELAFSKQKVNDRKDWLSSFVPGTFFDHQSDELNYSNFVNKELILFSVADNARSIPSIVDGMKPSQRKVLFACFKRKLIKTEIKVVQLAGYVSEHAAYHHGEMSLQATIVGLAQNYVGSNNINLLVPAGQFGTRLQGGKDAASSRYIFTKLSTITRSLIPELDDPILDYLEEDGLSIEPKWYCPVIPLVLVNGSDGIGTGWSSFLPCYNPRDLIKNIHKLLNDEEMEPMMPWYRGFTGKIVPVGNAKSFDVYGAVRKGNEENAFKIDELPVRSWTTPYKEFLESNIIGNSEAKTPFIKDFTDNGTEDKVRFTFTTTPEHAGELSSSAAYRRLKLSSSLSTNNMVLFDAEGRIRRYESPEEILQEFFTLRLDMYNRRRVHLLGVLKEELMCLDNKQRFIKMVIDAKLKVAKRKKKDLIAELRKLEFDPIFKKKKHVEEEDENENENDQDAGEEVSEADSGYNYLLSMPLWSLTAERVEQLGKQRDGKQADKDEMEATTGKELWLKDLDNLEQALTKNEEMEAEAKLSAAKKPKASGKGNGKKGKRGKAASAVVYEESEDELEIIDPPTARVIAVKKPRAKKTEVAAELAAKPKKRTGATQKTEKVVETLAESDESDSYSDHVDGWNGDADVEVAPRASRPARGAKKALPKMFDSDDESDENKDDKDDDAEVDDVMNLVDIDDEDDVLDNDVAPVPKASVAAARPKKHSVLKPPKVEENSDSDDDCLSLGERLAKRLTIKNRASGNGSDMGSPSEAAPAAKEATNTRAPRDAAAKKPPAPRKTGAKKTQGAKAVTDKVAGAKRRSAPKTKKAVDTVELSLSPGPSPLPKKTRVRSPVVKGKKGSSSKDEEVEEVVAVETAAARPSRPKRSRATARKIIVESDSEGDDDDDSVEFVGSDHDSDFE